MYEVNRSVLVLVPQAPFWNWLSHLPDIDLDGLELEDLQADSNAYLIDPVDEEEEAWEMISAKVDTIFSAELADWCEDRACGQTCTTIFSLNGLMCACPAFSPT